MAHLEEIEGIVLYQRKHRERDFLVKIFTERFGKIMFFVRVCFEMDALGALGA